MARKQTDRVQTLSVTDIPLRRRQRYLLWANAKEVRLYRQELEERVPAICRGERVPLVPGDLQIPRQEIVRIVFSYQRNRYGRFEQFLTFELLGGERRYRIPGDDVAQQVKFFFAARCDVPVCGVDEAGRHRLLLRQLQGVPPDIQKKDPAAACAYLQSSRWCKLLRFLSGISLPAFFLIVIADRNALILSCWVLCGLLPVAVTALYIRRQGDVTMAGGGRGRPGVLLAYLWNPLVLGCCAWAMVLSGPGWPGLRILAPELAFGLLCAVVFAAALFRWVRESRESLGSIALGALLAAAFGSQSAVVLLLCRQLLGFARLQ